MISHLRQTQATLVAVVVEQVARVAIADRQMEVRAGPGAIRERLRHEARNEAHAVRDFGRGHLEEDVAVGGGQRVAVGVIHLELAVGVFMIDLIDVEPGEPNNTNLYEWSPEQLKEAGIKVLPQNLNESLDALEEDRVLTGAIGADLTQEFLRLKRMEWVEYQRHVSSWEVERYLEFF